MTIRISVRHVAGAACLAAIVVISAASLPLAAQDAASVTLPAPTGPYAVGRIVEDWVDTHRIDVLAPDTDRKRELPVTIWYPAAPSPDARLAEYFPNPLRDSFRQSQAGNSLMTVDIAAIKSHAIADATLPAGERRFPIVLLKPALGLFALQYTALAEELASHGYVVAGSDSPYTTPVVVYSDGRVATRAERRPQPEAAADEARDPRTPGQDNALELPEFETWVEDEIFMLDHLIALNADDPSGRFTGRLDPETVGAFGHSYGGASALEFCRAVTACKGSINIDGAPRGDVVLAPSTKPFIGLMSDHPIFKKNEGEWSAPERELLDALELMRSGFPDEPSQVIVQDTGHFNFADPALYVNLDIARQGFMLGAIDPARALALTRDVVLAFFDEHLKGDAAESIAELAARYPEMQVD